MKAPIQLWKLVLATAIVAMAAAMPALAQVDKIAMRTTGIACGSCAATSEESLKRVGGIAKITVNASNEVVMLDCKPGSSFQPWDIREALEQSQVGVVQFQISARGMVKDEAGKKFFVAGKDKFLLTPATALKIPSNTQITIQGIVNDRPDPMELKVLDFKPAAKE